MPLLFPDEQLDGFGIGRGPLAGRKLVSAADDVSTLGAFAELELTDGVPDRLPLRAGDFGASFPGNREKRLTIISVVVEPGYG